MCQSYEEVYSLVPDSPSTVNWGWPLCEGPCGTTYWQATCPCSAGFTNPWYSYPHFDSSGCAPGQGEAGAAIMGGFVYYGNSFPSQYYGVYFFAEYVRNYIAYLPIDANKNAVTPAIMFDTQLPTSGLIFLTQGLQVSMQKENIRKIFAGDISVFNEG